MKKELVWKILYFIRTITFIAHIFLMFNLLYITLRMGYSGIILLILDVVYILNILIEMIGSKLRFKRDIIYHFMNISIFVYVLVLFIKIKTNYLNPSLSYTYLRNNYLILSVLMVILMIYSKIIVNKRQEKLN